MLKPALPDQGEDVVPTSEEVGKEGNLTELSGQLTTVDRLLTKAIHVRKSAAKANTARRSHEAELLRLQEKKQAADQQRQERRLILLTNSYVEVRTCATHLLGKLNQQEQATKEEIMDAGEEVQAIKTIMSGAKNLMLEIAVAYSDEAE